MNTTPLKFQPLPRRALNSLTIDQLVDYRKCERAYLLEHDDRLRYFRIRDLAHPFIWAGLCLYHAVQGIRIREIRGHIPKTNRPIIFAATHIGMYDVEIFIQALKKHMYLLAADEEAMYRTFDGWFFDANGVFYVIPEDRTDKHVAFETAVKYLKNGKNLLWYPEGTWNLTPNRVMLPLHYGIIDAAMQTDAIILPVAMEQHDGKHTISFDVNIGKPFSLPKSPLNKQDKIDLAEQLRGEMAALKMELWGTVSRAEFPPDYWQTFICKRLAEWPHYNEEIIRRRTFNPRNDVAAEEVFP